MVLPPTSSTGPRDLEGSSSGGNHQAVAGVAARPAVGTPASHPGYLLRVLGYARPYKVHLVLTTLVSAVSAAVSVVPPYLTKILVDEALVPGRSARLLTVVLAGMLGLEIAQLLLTVCRSRLYAWVGGRITLDVRRHLFGHLQRLSLRFHDQHQVGVLMARISQDAGSLQGFLTDAVPQVVVSVLTLVGALAITCSMNLALTLVALVPALFVAVGSVALARRLRPLHRLTWERWAGLSALLHSALAGIRVVKACAQEDRQEREFARESDELFRANMRLQWLTSTSMPMMGLIGSAVTLLVWGIGGRSILGGELTLGTLMAFLAYLGRLQGPVHFLAGLPAAYAGAAVGAQRLFEILDTEPEPYQSPGARRVARAAGAIEFSGVTFGYDHRRPVLSQIDLHLAPGEFIGIVGATGAGKTSLANLVCRFYDPDQGAVRLDGVDLRDLHLTDLRRQVGVVSQDSYLFDTSVAANIAYAQPEASRRTLLDTTSRVQAHGFVMQLPDAYDTLVGERGARLSAGERQRLALARAVLPDPAILILDEATSAIDAETEYRIQLGLATATPTPTVLAIAHRLSTLRPATRLVVLEAGRITDQGTPAELAGRPGLYSRLMRLQGSNGRHDAAVEPPVPLSWLAPNEIQFRRAGNGEMELALRNGPVWPKVRARRAFPLSAPWSCIEIHDAGGVALGLLESVAELDATSRAVLTVELDQRYALPAILRVRGISEEGGICCWQVDTESGPERLVLADRQSSVTALGADCFRLVDGTGRHFSLSLSQLDRASRRHLRYGVAARPSVSSGSGANPRGKDR